MDPRNNSPVTDEAKADEAARRIRARANVEQLLTTVEAAELLRLKPQTLRKWACRQSGPLRPRRLGPRLLWSAEEIRKLTAGVAA